MSVNKYQPHVFVLPEDDANRQLVNGFLQDQYLLNWKIKVLEEAGGWTKVLERFNSDQVVGMNRFSERFMVLLIDFDDHLERLSQAKAEIPDHLAERVFILGTSTEAEALKRAGLGTPEEIGLAMAKDCREGTDTIWSHDLLRHNAAELERLLPRVRPILFPS
jgi:hypothetical protein